VKVGGMKIGGKRADVSLTTQPPKIMMIWVGMYSDGMAVE